MNLARQLNDEEGRVKFAYRDHLGYLTIGVGRLIDKDKGGGLSNDEIDYLLNNDIEAKTSEVLESLPWVADLDEPRKAVIIGMAFQMGTAGLLRFKNTLAAVRAKRYSAAKEGILDSLWARQTPARAERMAKQMETGVWQMKG